MDKALWIIVSAIVALLVGLMVVSASGGIIKKTKNSVGSKIDSYLSSIGNVNDLSSTTSSSNTFEFNSMKFNLNLPALGLEELARR